MLTIAVKSGSTRCETMRLIVFINALPWYVELSCVKPEATHCRLTDHQLLFQNKPLVTVRHGKQLTLRDYRLKKEEILFISKVGFSLDITNPKVCVTSIKIISRM